MHAFLEGHAFLRKHQDKIHGVLSCFDRVIFRGYLPICHVRGLHGWLHQQGVKYWEFKNFAPKLAERLLQHAKDMAKAEGRPYQYLAKRQRMEELARQMAARDGVTEGLVCVFSCLETCRTFRLKYGQDKPRLEADLRRCTVLYYFFMDSECGLIHVKLHTWLPITCQVYVNGHSWLERQLARQGLPYTAADNAFVHLDDFEAAQRLADRFVKQKWRRRLDRWARRVNPLLQDVLRGAEGRVFRYYWVVDQAEYSTDVVFQKAKELAGLYPALVEEASLRFSSLDVLRFFGRKPHPSLQLEVRTEKKFYEEDDDGRRIDGTRVRHQLGTNRLKMYDKHGRVLRIETVINDPTQFRARRSYQDKHGVTRMAWLPLRKGVAWLWRYAQVSLAANRRYLEALALVHDPQVVRGELDRVCTAVAWRGGRRRGLQPLSPQDQALFLAALRGEHHLQGLRNRNLASQLYREPPKDPAERRRRCARVTRLIGLLRAHGLLAKIPRSRRYRVTPLGLRLMSAAIYVRYKYLPKEFREAA